MMYSLLSKNVASRIYTRFYGPNSPGCGGQPNFGNALEHLEPQPLPNTTIGAHVIFSDNIFDVLTRHSGPAHLCLRLLPAVITYDDV